MPWEVKCLLEEHEGLSLTAQHPCESLVWRLTSITSALEVGGRRDGPHLRSSVPDRKKKSKWKVISE